jgi:hypothetical protein
VIIPDNLHLHTLSRICKQLRRFLKNTEIFLRLTSLTSCTALIRENATRRRGYSQASMTQYAMKTFQLILKAKGLETAKALRNPEGLIVEKPADEFDDIAVAFERDLASSNRAQTL